MKKEHTLLTDELEGKLDIVEIISGDLPLKRKGPGYEGVCPFHKDDGTSLNIYPENQTWLCSGSCAVTRKLNRLAPANHGDATSFVARIEGISFGDAIRKLAVRCGLAPRNGAQQEQTDVPVLRQPRKAMAAAQKIPGMYIVDMKFRNIISEFVYNSRVNYDKTRYNRHGVTLRYY